jgi:hypothetical protein
MSFGVHYRNYKLLKLVHNLFTVETQLLSTVLIQYEACVIAYILTNILVYISVYNVHVFLASKYLCCVDIMEALGDR